MSRRRRYERCVECFIQRLDDEEFYRGRCLSCRSELAAKRRAATGARAIAKAKATGTVERDGQMFSVVQLPPKRRGGRQIR